MENQKRKTKTSSAVKNRYNEKMYGTIVVKLKKELVAEFKAKCVSEGVSQAKIIRSAVEDYLKKAEL